MAWNSIRRLADAIRNDLYSGLRGMHLNMSLSVEQLELDVVDTRLTVIKEYMMQGVLPILDLLVSINCIPVDCEGLSKCKCNKSTCGNDPIAHFLLPQILFDYGTKKAIQYIGSSDKLNSFLVYTKPFQLVSTILKYRRRGKNKPWVYIDVTPNSEGLIDCYIFGAPLIKQVSVTAIFKDPRQLEDFQCDCDTNNLQDVVTAMDTNFNFLDTVIRDRVLKLKFFYYRQAAKPLEPNNQNYSAG